MAEQDLITIIIFIRTKKWTDNKNCKCISRKKTRYLTKIKTMTFSLSQSTLTRTNLLLKSIRNKRNKVYVHLLTQAPIDTMNHPIMVAHIPERAWKNPVIVRAEVEEAGVKGKWIRTALHQPLKMTSWECRRSSSIEAIKRSAIW